VGCFEAQETELLHVSDDYMLVQTQSTWLLGLTLRGRSLSTADDDGGGFTVVVMVDFENAWARRARAMLGMVWVDARWEDTAVAR
jgi:hypothetical protein